MQTVEVRNTTLMVDQDGDGIAELRQILVAGDKILDNEEIEECRTGTQGCPTTT